MLKIEQTRFISLNKISNIHIHNFCHYFEQSRLSVPQNKDLFLVVYIKRGFVKVSFDDTSILAKSGDIIAAPGSSKLEFSFSAYESQATPDYYVLHLADISDMIPDESCPVINLTSAPEVLSSKFQLLESELMTQKDGWENICSCELNVLMRLISRDVMPLSESIAAPASRSDQLFKEILDYIHVHYCEKITLQSVADYFFISPYYLSHLFDNKKAVSLMQYITHLRIHEAQMLLRTTDYPVKQIAQMTGYQNANYFFNVFKQKTGMSPNLYRSENSSE